MTKFTIDLSNETKKFCSESKNFIVILYAQSPSDVFEVPAGQFDPASPCS